ncbi:hypothetical protein IU459_12005 [Nocardia amamiensis]|uniref:Uncharacterized protein n=1 Tax=Nocardia amamiensis TaxID=404578 RepID=A0ABS0CQ47_9NOCA|nr:hypothetical protein [Nocardia amamiensis]MBF6298265.1 hypothetical protein [Nocardia amamiensis]
MTGDTVGGAVHSEQGCAAAPLALAAQATAMFVRAVTEYYDDIGRPLPDLTTSGPAR